jgi:hypothetical protein
VAIYSSMVLNTILGIAILLPCNYSFSGNLFSKTR